MTKEILEVVIRGRTEHELLFEVGRDGKMIMVYGDKDKNLIGRGFYNLSKEELEIKVFRIAAGRYGTKNVEIRTHSNFSSREDPINYEILFKILDRANHEQTL